MISERSMWAETPLVAEWAAGNTRADRYLRIVGLVNLACIGESFHD